MMTDTAGVRSINGCVLDVRLHFGDEQHVLVDESCFGFDGRPCAAAEPDGSGVRDGSDSQDGCEKRDADGSCFDV
jgi:hypothetical protein